MKQAISMPQAVAMALACSVGVYAIAWELNNQGPVSAVKLPAGVSKLVSTETIRQWDVPAAELQRRDRTNRPAFDAQEGGHPVAQTPATGGAPGGSKR